MPTGRTLVGLSKTNVATQDGILIIARKTRAFQDAAYCNGRNGQMFYPGVATCRFGMSRSPSISFARGAPMPRRIILLSDGTGNSSASFWRTNVWRMFCALDLTNNDQVACYD